MTQQYLPRAVFLMDTCEYCTPLIQTEMRGGAAYSMLAGTGTPSPRFSPKHHLFHGLTAYSMVTGTGTGTPPPRFFSTTQSPLQTNPPNTWGVRHVHLVPQNSSAPLPKTKKRSLSSPNLPHASRLVCQGRGWRDRTSHKHTELVFVRLFVFDAPNTERHKLSQYQCRRSFPR